MRRGGPTFALLGVAVAASCARYEPQPIDPAIHVSEYRARNLDDSSHLQWVTKWAGPIAPRGWTDRQLAVAGLRLRAEIQRARREWDAARAGEQAAGARPQPGASADVERAVSGNGEQSPWVVALGGLYTVELGGKRGARLQQARAKTTAAEADLALVAWQVIRGIRAAALAVTLADGERQAMALELTTIGTVLDLERQRFAEAAVSSSEVARTGSEVEEVRASLARAEREVIEARGALSAAEGVPPRAMDSIAIVPVASHACERLDSVGMDSLETLALSTRPEIARALAEYAGAEASLKLQVAHQFPDLDLGPGFIWDQGVHRWTLALAVPGLLAFRNRGPIAAATANRRASAARVAESQDSILGELTIAAEGCRGARLEQAAADSQIAVAQRSLTRARAAYERGETGRLDAALAELAVVRAGNAKRAAYRRGMLAGLALEAAIGEWGGEAGTGWPDPRVEPAEEVRR